MSELIELYKKQQPNIHKTFELKEKLEASDGYRVYQEITKSRTAFFIYKENYSTLIKSLKRYYLNPKILSENSVKRWRQQRLLSKDFYNVIVSARAYIEQNDFDRNHLDDPFFCFMKELRNYIVHKEVLPFSSNAEYKHREAIRQELIDLKPIELFINESIAKDKKEKFKGLRKAIAYLETLPKNASLNKLLQEYDDKITALHRYLVLRKVKANYEALHNFGNDFLLLNEVAKNIGITSGVVITEAKHRHLISLLSKAQIISLSLEILLEQNK